MVKLRDIALVGGIVTAGYFLLRGGASALSSGGDYLSGFAAGIEGAIAQLTGSTPLPGGSGSGSGSNAGDSGTVGKPPFPFLPTPPGTSIPTALGIGGANLGIGLGVLGAGYATGRYIAPSLAQRAGQFIRNFRSPTSPNIEDLTTEISPVTLGEEAALPGIAPFGYNDIQRASNNTASVLSQLTGRHYAGLPPAPKVAPDFLGQFLHPQRKIAFHVAAQQQAAPHVLGPHGQVTVVGRHGPSPFGR